MTTAPVRRPSGLPRGLTAEAPLRDLTEDEIATFERDGVILAKGLFQDSWVAHVGDAIDRMIEHPTPYGELLSRGKGLYTDLFMWKYSEAFRDFAYYSPAARIAAQAARSSRINFLVDQMFKKDPGCDIPTSWHTDSIAWPVAGEQLVNIWLACDHATTENSAIQFIRGSHRWPTARSARAAGELDDARVAEALGKLGWKPTEPMTLEGLEEPLTVPAVTRAAFRGVHRRVEEEMTHAPLPGGLRGLVEIEPNRDRLPIVGWDVEPGDALIFHLGILHYSTGTSGTGGARRALATRWLGDDVRYAPTTGSLPTFWEHGLRPGDRFGGPLHPQILPEVVPGEGDARFRQVEEADAHIGLADLKVRLALEEGAA